MPITTLPLEYLLSSTSHNDFSARRQLSDVSTSIAKAKKVIVVSGAGISCSSGIPDFRSEDGLYALVKNRYPNTFFTGKDLFSASLFNHPNTTSVFYSFIAELSAACNKAQPTKTHHFIHKLEKTGKLLRSYTQNVDGFERRMGIESGGRGQGLHKKKTRNVELHGDLGRVRCTLCMKDYPAKEEWTAVFREGEAPECPACFEKCALVSRQQLTVGEDRRKRSARAITIGSLRPSIVLYEEAHPLGDDIGLLQGFDMSQRPDVLLIMGTSLKVHGLKRLVKDFAKVVHNPAKGKPGTVIFVNATAPSKEWEGVIDVHVHGQTDQWVEKVEEEWRRIRPSDWEHQTLLDGEMGLGVALPVPVKAKPTKSKAAPISQTIWVEGHVPTPRPSRSPSQPSPQSHAPSSPLSAAPSSPVAPLSPSKRNINNAMLPTPPDSQESPTKRSRATEPPVTGCPATPGRGNLFAGASAPEDAGEVFGSPAKALPKKAVRKVKKAGSGDKENAPPPAAKETAPVVKGKSGRTLKTKKSIVFAEL